jgi:DNA-directed RNA polymerase subunit beta'
MRGLMAKPSGDIIELPIRSNFKEGLSVIEFFISTNGARKGLADTALKTADAGYLTRRLVDIAQDVVVNDDDCGTINGLNMTALKEGEEIVETLAERIVGRFTLEQVKNPITGEVIIDVNELITEDKAKQIEDAGIESVSVRTVLTCEAKYGVCKKCYGRNLATNDTVEIGEAVGIIAAQSIGQPGTQLTMRTFHIGGAATKVSEENKTYLKFPVIIKDIQGTTVTLENGESLFTRRGFVIVSRILESLEIQKGDRLHFHDGDKVVKGQNILRREKEEIQAGHNAYISVSKDKNRVYLIAQDQKVSVRNGAMLHVKAGDVLPAEQTIASFDPFSEPIIAEFDGTVKFEDIVLGTTLKEEINEDTGNIEKKITDYTSESLQPRVRILNKKGEDLAVYFLPGSSYLNINDGDKIKGGRIIAKLLKESVKTGDITGGLPRVGELFEARRPKTSAILSQISGTVRFKGIVKAKRIIIVEDAFGKEFKHLVPMGRHLLVREGDIVDAGEPLCDGSKDPHDILQILGENALQRYMMDEVQGVYKLQGVGINDKHGVIIRQMMRKVEITSVGDTNFIFGQQVDKYRFHEENAKVARDGGLPAIGKPLLLGITRASLNIDSFFSAASFQETTRVLTNAAIAGSVDSLRGLKENVIIGHPIPAGTGMKKYRPLKLYNENEEDLDTKMQLIMEAKQKEREDAELMREEIIQSVQEDPVLDSGDYADDDDEENIEK